MIVIGFNWPIEHDHVAAIIQDGKLVFAAKEERFTRHKHSPGESPIGALKEAFKFLKKQGIKHRDVEAYTVNFDSKIFSLKIKRNIYFRNLKYTANLDIIRKKTYLM